MRAGSPVLKARSFSTGCPSSTPARVRRFAMRSGMRVGIMGPTGAGKTTLVSLLARFYDPTSGAILLDGTNLREYHVADLRRQFAIVLQEPILFSTSIAENIRSEEHTSELQSQ